MYDHTDPRVTAEPCHPGTPPLAAEREHRSATVDAIAAARSHGQEQRARRVAYRDSGQATWS
jgi:hypothetical protein